MPSFQDIKRKFSLRDKEQPDLDQLNDADDFDDETAGRLGREFDKAQENNEQPYGKPGSFLYRLIMHGNKKTEEQAHGHGAF
ncbi:hypothetical protein K470DRAFT_29653 [Piedraia hortae CBS 480.64]|uniref:Uncharacterized protein n=1 Tax=Piedraia hortae CBS 480.64 TaxID=1314780 RepID=A0A6A7C2L8_9PEZI|nr:hypothetical protein K470DRAFT_29653 [Piedraia hortae CBS 480.64]